ncbi:hypothetical protein Pla123a_27710 [Posidoniimonas polymericola]|uniref:THUMP-like domain-containing protein n=1 Tax=Posidoniimonas polymericola TaxID=2528002 RepID=A0A5C5YMA6_9BACT|nr:SAM-dependent methyltransferase [Posidoniimonas polymericola]TWT75985.1 hypothetical protein Pla123a_27710 [Posidoniimonas polymericola]
MTTPADLSDLCWLLSDEGRVALAGVAADDAPLHTQAARLRKTHSAERTALLLEQHELRGRAHAKFGRAEQMFFTRVGLQQATDEAAARYKASRFAAGSRVVDVCTGIGGDLIALAGHADAVGVDNDPSCALIAEANLAVCGHGQTKVVVTQAGVESLSEAAAWHADPDRRNNGRRTTQLELHSPGRETLEAMLAAQPSAAIKLAPAAEPPPEWEEQHELEWLSRDGECRQLCVWTGALAARPGSRRAASVDQAGELAGAFDGKPKGPQRIAGKLGEFLVEPDAAVLAAKLTNAFAAELDLKRVSRGIAYLTGDAPPAHPLCRVFRLLETLPLKQKQIAAALRARSVGRLEIKHRGVRLDPHTFRKQLKLRGDNAAILIAFPTASGGVAALAERVTPDQP